MALQVPRGERPITLAEDVDSGKRLHELQRRATVDAISSPSDKDRAPTRSPSRRSKTRQIYPAIDASVTESQALNQGQTFNVQSSISLSEPNNELPISAAEAQPSKVRHPLPFIWNLAHDVRQLLSSDSGDDATLDERSIATYTVSQTTWSHANLSYLPIPPKAHLFHLAQVAHFHLNQTYSFFDYSTLEKQWNRAHLRLVQSQPDIWHVKFLIVAAIGKLFLEKGATIFGPPGIQEFLQCIPAISTILCRVHDAPTTIETLCLMAFYAQSADMHTAAHLYVGQACRLARLYETDRGAEGSANQILWWNICLLDQRLAVTINASPDCRLHEQKFDAAASDETCGASPGFRLQANLAIAHVLTDVSKVIPRYERTTSMNLTFVTAVSQQIATLMKVGRAIRTTEPLCYNDSLATISRSAGTLHLLYCHCAMGASIPFLLHLITPPAAGQVEGNASFSTDAESVLGMVKVGVGAAALTLSILSALREQSLLEVFSFLDSEATFLSALLLVLANIISPGTTDTSFVKVATGILQDMASTGNIPAGALKDELTRICELAAGCSSTHGTPYARLSYRQLTVFKDAVTLNNAILNVIDIPLAAPGWPESTAGAVEPFIPDFPTGGQSTIPSVQQGEPLHHIEASASLFTDDFDAVGDPFDFNMVDLDWLDLI
ncbi:hypothetical protein PV11_00463 [Exophiala sideris]|uniref:Transcription factor domain-containing protein n=1 Tax=Exophiala sideris TaxID=1016849 RepID=A0A0D1W7K1_9EURO|nr:hypothetical protein PV11_00463 [Exophiala sideris]